MSFGVTASLLRQWADAHLAPDWMAWFGLSAVAFVVMALLLWLPERRQKKCARGFEVKSAGDNISEVKKES